MGSDDDYPHRPRHHISHKVTLAAVSSLFAVTLLVILLFLYVKYRQNRNLHRRRVDFVSRMITAQQSDRPDPSKSPVGGLDPDVLNLLPVTVCGRSEGAFECSVCLAQVVEGVSLRLLPNCGHSFHVNCVDTWLASHTTCPLCRAEVEPPPPPQTVVGSVDPTAPPVDEMSLLHGESSAEGKQAGGSRLSSFRRMLSRGRSVEACGDSAAAAAAPNPQEVVLVRQ